MRFSDRRQAGQLLAKQLGAYSHQARVLVLALPRGGVPVACEVAAALDAPLDVLVVRKLGVPHHPEYAMGAIAAGGVRVMNPDAAYLRLDPSEVEAVAVREQQELARRERLYRGARAPLSLRGHTVILVDDGLATGSTMRAAALSARQQGAERIVVAVPVAAPETAESLRSEGYEVICVATPAAFRAVGLWYDDFDQVSDDEVRTMLAEAGLRVQQQ
jgi:putative phosphoribosyl transferase